MKYGFTNMILKKNTIKEQWLTGGSDPVTAKVDAARYKGILHVNFFGGPKNNNICLFRRVFWEGQRAFPGKCSGKASLERPLMSQCSLCAYQTRTLPRVLLETKESLVSM